MKTPTPLFPSRISRSTYVLLLVTALVLLLVIFQTLSIIRGVYISRQDKLYKIDSVQLLPSRFGEAGVRSGLFYEFVDKSRHRFIISGPAYDAVPRESHLYDTLQYGDHAMTVYTDKQGLSDYLYGRQDDRIPVYGLQSAHTSFISLPALTRNERDAKISFVVYIVVGYLLYLFCYAGYKIRR